MTSRSQYSSNDIHALLHEQLEAMLSECEHVMNNATYGQTINHLDSFLLVEGKKFIREVLRQKLQERIRQIEAEEETKQCPKCKKKTTYRYQRSKTIVTAHDHIPLERTYRYCTPCKHPFFPVDANVGLDKTYTHELKRLVSRCVGLGSYRLGEENLEELCQIHLSHTTIGKVAAETADEMEARLHNNPDIRKDFQEADGETEVLIDGTIINTRNADGKQEYREAKIALAAKRECGESATACEWATRELPEPTVTYVVTAIESKEDFQKRVEAMRRFLGIGGITSALADGAVWIWSLIFMVFGKTSECLDIYHALENVSSCGKALYGSGQKFTEWLDRMRLVLLSEGFAGMERELELLKMGLGSEERKPVDSLLEYLRNNSGRLTYFERLAAGRAIGSGQVEGACKNLIGKRLKQTKACWRVPQANKIAKICAILYSGQWKNAWSRPT